MDLQEDIVRLLKVNKDYSDSRTGISGDYANFLILGTDGKPYYNALPLEGDFGTAVVLNDGGFEENLRLLNIDEYNSLGSLSGSDNLLIQGNVISRDKLLEYRFGEDCVPKNSSLQGFLWNCVNLRFISDLPFSFEIIEDNFLRGCTNFDSNVILGDNVVIIRDNFLSGCTNYQSTFLTLPYKLNYIGLYFLRDCTSFNKSIVFPSNHSFTIKSFFMYNCKSMSTKIHLTSNIKLEGVTFFYNWLSYKIDMVFDCDIPSKNVQDADSTLCTTEIVDGLHICGDKRFEWLDAFPNSSSSPYRKLLPCTEPYNDWGTLGYQITSYKKVKLTSQEQFNSLFNPVSTVKTNDGNIPIDNLIDFEFGLDVNQYLTTISAGFLKNTSIKHLGTIPEQITEIKGDFLRNCYNLGSKVTLPSNLQRIGSYFLAYSNYDYTLYLPNKLTYIGEYFLFNSKNFSSTIFWSSKPDLNLTATSTYVSSDDGSSYLYTKGVAFCGEYGSSMQALLKDINGEGGLYRKIKSCNESTLPIIIKYHREDTSIEIYGFIDTEEGYTNLCTVGSDILIETGERLNRDFIVEVLLTDYSYYFFYYNIENFCIGMKDLRRVIVNNDYLFDLGKNFCKDCTSLESLTLPLNAIDFDLIGSGFLENCTSFNTHLVIPSSVNTIESYFCYNCKKLTSIEFNVLPNFPTSNDKKTVLSTDDGRADMYIKGIKVCGSVYQQVIDKLPISHNAPYRYLIPCGGVEPPSVYWAMIEYGPVTHTEFTGFMVNELQFNTLYGNSTITVNTSSDIPRSNVGRVVFGEQFISHHRSLGNDFCSNLTNLVEVKFYPTDMVTSIGDNFFSNCKKLNFVGFKPFNAYTSPIGSGFLSDCVLFNQDLHITKENIVNLNGFLKNCESMTSLITFDGNIEPNASDCLTLNTNTAPAYINGIRVNGDYGNLLLDYYPNSYDFPFRNLYSFYPDLSNLVCQIEYKTNQGTFIATQSNNEQLQSLFNQNGMKNVETDQGLVLPSYITKILFGNKADSTLFTTSTDFCNNFLKLEKIDLYNTDFETINDRFCFNCPVLSIVILPSNLKNIGNEFLNNCRSFNQTLYLKNILTIGNKFLNNCNAYNKEFKFEKLTSIGDYFLYNCIQFNQVIDFNNIKDILAYIGHEFLSLCTSFNQELDLTQLHLITDLGANSTDNTVRGGILREAISFNKKLRLPDNIKSCLNVLWKATSFNQEILIPTNFTYSEQNPQLSLYTLSEADNFTNDVIWNTRFNPGFIDDNQTDNYCFSSNNPETPIATEGFTANGIHNDILLEMPDNPNEDEPPFRHIKNR